MKKKKIYIVLLGILGFLVLAGVAAGSFTKFYLPDVGEATDIKIALTPERIERGRYLANSVAVCMDCHSSRDWSQFAAPLAGGLGGGGERFGKDMGFPGTLYSPNITPYGIGDWTDGEVLRAITTGVDKDGNALFPLMPYRHYGQIDKEDIYSIIAYIRTLEPIENEPAERELDFPVSLLVMKLTSQDLNSPMPWYMYANMKEQDLEAIYAYLKSLKPIDHQVVRYEKQIR